MFEDAVQSGNLSLRARKIKDFPSNLCALHDLSDLISADLSLNRLHELPACICELDFLENLCLRSNAIQRLPSSIHLLKSLALLDLSGNQLQALPSTLFFLRLKILLLAGNRLTSVPREIRQFESLTELDLSFNRLTDLPSDIALLKNLRVLNVASNRLIELPGELGFMHLRMLDARDNGLTAVPVDFFNLSGSLVQLKIEGNPLVAPPIEIALKGREHIFKWLRSQSCENSAYRSYNEWAFSRCSNINATLRRPERICHEKASKLANDTCRKPERRARQNRFNTVGGSDSGYTSTGDEHRYSHEMVMSKGSLEEINERCDSLSTPSTERSYADGEVSGDLAKEVMLAYADSVLERKMAAHDSNDSTPASPTSSVPVSPNAAAAMDVSNNNVPPETTTSTDALPVELCPSPETTSSTSSDEGSDQSPINETPTHLPTQNGQTGKENGAPKEVKGHKVPEPTRLVPPQESLSESSSLSDSGNTTSSSGSSSVPEPKIAAPTAIAAVRKTNGIAKSHSVDEPVKSKLVKPKTSVMVATAARTTASAIPKKPSPPTSRVPTTTATTARSASRPATSAIRKPSLSTSKIAPAPSTSNIARKSDPTNNKSAATSRLAASTTNLARSRPTEATTNSALPTRRAAPPAAGMSKSVIGLSKKPPTTATFSSSLTTANAGTTTSTSNLPTTSGNMVDSMKRVIESKLTGTKLPGDNRQVAAELASGSLLCNFANKIRVRAVPTVYNPIPGETQMSPLKAKRNAEGFVAACKRLGVSETYLCSASDITERQNLVHIARTVLALSKLAPANASSMTLVASRV